MYIVCIYIYNNLITLFNLEKLIFTPDLHSFREFFFHLNERFNYFGTLNYNTMKTLIIKVLNLQTYLSDSLYIIYVDIQVSVELHLQYQMVKQTPPKNLCLETQWSILVILDFILLATQLLLALILHLIHNLQFVKVI